jgi:hypothetical protein
LPIQGFDERAIRDHFHSCGTHLIECALHQSSADTASAEFRRHLGMHEGDDVALYLVEGGGEMSVDQ